MTKVKNPLLGLKAQGSLGNAVTFQDRGKGTMVRQKPMPTDPKTLAQIYHRWLYQDYAAQWLTLSPNEMFQWVQDARRRHITGFNLWMSTKLDTLPDIALGLHLDSISASTAIDFSKNLNHGTVFGAQLADGVIGRCLSLDGTDDYINCGNDNSLDITGAITLEAHVNLHDLGSSHILIGKWGAAGNRSYILYFDFGAQKWAFFITDSDGAAKYALSPTPTPGTFQHVAGTYDRANLTCYVNAIPGTPTPWVKPIFTSTADLLLGKRIPLLSPLHGLIDEPRVYNRALSTSGLERHSERRYP